MTTQPEQELKSIPLQIPLLLRVASILIIAEGFLGALFFLSAGIFQLNNSSFIGNKSLSGLNSNFYSFYIVLHILLFSGFALSGFFLLKLRKIGYYLFIINYLVFAGFSIYLNGILGWSTLFTGLVTIGVLSYFRKKLI